jgi:hypothetical protein
MNRKHKQYSGAFKAKVGLESCSIETVQTQRVEYPPESRGAT